MASLCRWVTVLASVAPTAILSAPPKPISGTRAGILGWYLLVIMFPPGLTYLGMATSFALGVAIVAGIAILLSAWGRDNGVSARHVVSVITIAITGLLLHLLIAGEMVPIDFPRAFSSLLLLAILVLAGGALANRWQHVQDARAHRGLRQVFFLMCVVALLGVIGIAPPSFAEEQWRRPVFPFSEPSIFALALSPVLLYVCISVSGSQRMLILVAWTLGSVITQSLTLAAVVMLASAVTLTAPRLLLVIAVAGFALMSTELNYFLDRIGLTAESDNLSHLVYLQGWQMVQEAWEATGGWGIGYQQLGVHGTNVPAAEAIRALRGGEDMNLLDGGFVLAKLSADFGAFGGCVTVFYLFFSLRSAWWLRQSAIRGLSARPVVLLSHCVIVSFLIELFGRSSGYLTGSVLLLAASFWTLHGKPSRSS